jgi:hypothetical protein
MQDARGSRQQQNQREQGNKRDFAAIFNHDQTSSHQGVHWEINHKRGYWQMDMRIMIALN